MSNEGKGFWSSIPGILTGLAAVIGAIAGLYVAFKPGSAPITPPQNHPIASTTNDGVTPASRPQSLMGPLEHGWNYDHNDLDPNGWLSVASADACSDLCYARTDCKAMTYVVSNKSCWLKYAVPSPTQNTDMISAVKQ
jgi:hypothetical protein